MPDNKDMMNNSEQHSDCDYKQSNITTDKSKKAGKLFDTDYKCLSDLMGYPDAEVRMVAFTESLHEAIVTDDEPWHKKGFDMMHALQTGNIEYFLAMACGWGAKSLAKRAMIIPDSENMYHSEDEAGTLVVYWEDGVETSSNCKVDAATFHVWGWAEDAFKHPFDANVQIARIGIRVAPIEVDNLYEFCCVSKKERDMSGYDSLYWYDSMFNSIP